MGLNGCLLADTSPLTSIDGDRRKQVEAHLDGGEDRASDKTHTHPSPPGLFPIRFSVRIYIALSIHTPRSDRHVVLKRDDVQAVEPFGVISTHPGRLATFLGHHIPLTNTEADMALRNYQPTPRVGEDIQRRSARLELLSLDSDTNSEVFNLIDNEVLDVLKVLDSFRREVKWLEQRDVVKYGDRLWFNARRVRSADPFADPFVFGISPIHKPRMLQRLSSTQPRGRIPVEELAE